MTERVTGLGRRTREEIAKWNQMITHSPEIPDRVETSDIPSLPSGETFTSCFDVANAGNMEEYIKLSMGSDI